VGSHSKTTTTVAPPSWAQGTITNALGAERGAYNQGSGLFSQFEPAIKTAIGNTAALAAKPPQFQLDAQNQLDKTINGDYLTPDSNPYEAAMGKQIADQTTANYNTAFGGAGRSHGGLAALLSSQGVGNALDNFYGNIYNQERGLQQQATLNEPSLNADQYTGANNLISETQAASMTPEQLAALYGSSVAGTVGPYGTTTQKTTQPFGLSQLLGLGLMAGGAIMGSPSAAMGGANMASAASAGSGLAGLIPPITIPSSPYGNAGLSSYFSSNPFGGI
jgi:hypothetical protein